MHIHICHLEFACALCEDGPNGFGMNRREDHDGKGVLDTPTEGSLNIGEGRLVVVKATVACTSLASTNPNIGEESTAPTIAPT